jgi:hypothetical protein
MTFWDMFQTNENSLYARKASVPMGPKGHIASRAAHPVQIPGLIGIVGDGDDDNVNLFRSPPYARLCIRGRSSVRPSGFEFEGRGFESLRIHLRRGRLVFGRLCGCGLTNAMARLPIDARHLAGFGKKVANRFLDHRLTIEAREPAQLAERTRIERLLQFGQDQES